MVMYRLKKRHIRLFRHTVQRVVRLLSLGSWRVVVYPVKPNKRNRFILSWVRWNASQRLAEVNLLTSWTIRPIRQQILRTAVHEVLHILLYEMDSAMRLKKVRTEVVDAWIHAVIVPLELPLVQRLEGERNHLPKKTPPPGRGKVASINRISNQSAMNYTE